MQNHFKLLQKVFQAKLQAIVCCGIITRKHVLCKSGSNSRSSVFPQSGGPWSTLLTSTTTSAFTVTCAVLVPKLKLTLVGAGVTSSIPRHHICSNFPSALYSTISRTASIGTSIAMVLHFLSVAVRSKLLQLLILKIGKLRLQRPL